MVETIKDDDNLLRKVKIKIAHKNLDSKGKRVLMRLKNSERPVHKLVIVLAKETGDPRRRAI